MSIEADRQRAALHRISADDPDLAARLILMTLPAAAAPAPANGAASNGSGDLEAQATY